MSGRRSGYGEAVITPTSAASVPPRGHAWFAGLRLRDAVECVDLTDPSPLDRGGMWVVVAEFDGPGRAWRFADVRRGPWPAAPDAAADAAGDDAADVARDVARDVAAWVGPPAAAWRSSMTRADYLSGVAAIRARIRAGEVYQVNLCRFLAAALPGPEGAADGDPDAEPDAAALAARLAAVHPAPFAGGIHVPEASGLPPAWVVSASPELFLRVVDGRISSGPIKGTATSAEGLSDKDVAENVMIADMVRNDLQRVCAPGTVEVSALLEVERHPGLVHLVTTVTGRLVRPGWAEVLAATFPPASVSGAPKHTALQAIADLEPVPRGPYCGAFGWVDADAGRAELAVAIRSFWWDAGDRMLRFGTGAGITWGSDAEAEWAETELKAERLVALASSGGASGIDRDGGHGSGSGDRWDRWDRMGSVDGGSGS